MDELIIEHLSVALGGRTIVHDTQLAIGRGEVLALLGPSGCGKTTLLRAIAGLNAASAGRLLIEGRDLTEAPPQARRIGMVFQHYALFPNMSVLANVMFGAESAGMAKAAAQAQAERLLELVDLRAHAAKRPAQLSGGQRQRVALARALARDPRVLLMDEPFSALDESFRVPLRRAFRSLQRELGQTCVIVTHDRDEAFELADRVAVMFDGRIVQVAAPRALWREPATRRVADFLGAHNILDAAAAPGEMRRDRGAWLVPHDGLRIAAGHEAADQDEWQVHATITHVFDTLRGTALEVRTDDGSVLEADLAHDGAGFSAGQRVVCGVRRSRVRYVED